MLKKYGLYQDEITMTAAMASEQHVYGVRDEEDMLVSTWDFMRYKPLPPDVWALSCTRDGVVYQIHFSLNILLRDEKSVRWCAEMLKLQMFLKTHYNE